MGDARDALRPFALRAAPRTGPEGRPRCPGVRTLYGILPDLDDPVMTRAAELSDGPVTVQLLGPDSDSLDFNHELLGVEVPRAVALLAWATADDG